MAALRRHFQFFFQKILVRHSVQKPPGFILAGKALGLPSDKASRIALRTQQVIFEESGVSDTSDPLGGSYLIESLTDQIEQRVTRLIHDIDEMGGMIRAIESGFPQREIERAAYDYQTTCAEP